MGAGAGGRGAGDPVVLEEIGGALLELQDEFVQMLGQDLAGAGQVRLQGLRGGAGLLTGVGGAGDRGLVGGDLVAQVGDFGGCADEMLRQSGTGFGGGSVDAQAFGGRIGIAAFEEFGLGEAGAFLEVVVANILRVGGGGGGQHGSSSAHAFAQGLLVFGQAAGAGLLERVRLNGGGGGLEFGVVFEPGRKGFPLRLMAVNGDDVGEKSTQVVFVVSIHVNDSAPMVFAGKRKMTGGLVALRAVARAADWLSPRCSRQRPGPRQSSAALELGCASQSGRRLPQPKTLCAVAESSA